MQQLFRTLLAVLALLCCALSTVSAGPAPALTRIEPIALWSEATEAVSAEADYPNRLPEGTVFRGENLFIKTRFDLRVVVGYEQIVSIPFAEIGTAEIDLCIAAADAGSGAPRHTVIRGVQTEK